MNLKGKTALITGASSGIGEAFAFDLAKRGCNVILVARSQPKLEKLAGQIELKYGVRAPVFVSDLSRPEAPGYLFEAVKRANFSVDLLINNAAFGYSGPFEGLALEKDSAMMHLNMHSLVALSRLFLPEMLDKKHGGIINVASTAGFQPMPGLALYAATKAFVLSFSEALWAECKNRGVRIFCLCPGNTRTEFHQIAGIQPRKIFFAASAEEVARYGIDVFLASDRPTAIVKWPNRVLAFGYRLLPRRWVVEIAARIYRDNTKRI